MKKLALAYLLVLLILLAGCQNVPNERRSPDPAQGSSPTPAQPAPAAPLPSQTPDLATEEAPALEPTATTASTANPTDPARSLPSPSLFPGSWDDRDIYLSGLVPDEAGILGELPGATVYHLNLDISDPTMIEGVMEARYTNQEDVALDELVLHMFPEELGGSMNIANIRLNGEAAESQTTSGILKIDLPEPLEPGEQVVLSLDFVTNVPGEESTKYKVLAFSDNILALAHFYPMFAVYDDGGWHTEPPADHGDETFADMSFYLVQVDAPEDQVLVAAGVEADLEQTAGKQRVTFAAAPVRDFYLVSSDNLDVAQRQLGPVMLSSYAPPDRIEGAEMALDVAAHSLESYAARFGAYPYSELDIVSTPTDALGIEYPGIFANALRIYDLSENTSGLPNAVLLESVTAHETGHQWFYNLVGNDQLNEPWLDEATTQYATWMYYVDRYGEQNAQGYYDSLDGRWARTEYADIPIGLPADAYSGLEYGAIVYGRGPIFLNELAEVMGQETFDGFLRDYSEQYRWQIAYAQDFMDLAEQHCDCDLSGLFAEQVFGN